MYELLKNSNQTKVIGGKDNGQFKTDIGRNRILSTLAHEERPCFLFNHDIIFSKTDLNALEKLPCTYLVIVREPIEQIVSRILHDIRVGLYTLDDVQNCNKLQKLNPQIIERSNYKKIYARVSNLSNPTIFLNFENFKNDACIQNYLQIMTGLENFNVPLIKNSNQAKLSKKPKFTKFIRDYLKPVIINLGGEASWSAMKLSNIAQLMYTDDKQEILRHKSIIRAKVEQQVNPEALREPRINFSDSLC